MLTTILTEYENRLIAIREDHRDSVQEAVNTVVGLPLNEESSGTILVEGADFYSNPRVSPAGDQVIWLSWNHPNMPWDETELWLADMLEDGLLGNARKLAGGTAESIFQPQWSPDGSIYFISDRTGWWNLYRWQGAEIEIMLAMEAEFAIPQWTFGRSTYAFISEDEILCSYDCQGSGHLARFDIPTRQLNNIDTPYSNFESIQANRRQAVFSAGAPTEVVSVVRLQIETEESDVLRRSSSIAVDKGYLAQPESLEFPTENGLSAYGFYYPPRNCDSQAPNDELPPLLVMSHGGPTSATSAVLNFSVQYWTSRGFAILDVNYGGSTGYGRAYRERLKGQWGLVDIHDCINGARHLVNAGKVDGTRLAIRGGSAGGYTTLGALAFHDVFQAGASYFGVSDIESLVKETHKFESRYLDSPDRSLSRAARAVSAAFADLSYRTTLLPCDIFSGPGRQNCAAESGEKYV